MLGSWKILRTYKMKILLTNKTLIISCQFTFILQPSMNILSWDTWEVLKMISVLQMPALEFVNNPKSYFIFVKNIYGRSQV